MNQYKINKIKYDQLCKLLFGGAKTKKYMTHDNGGRPFMIKVSNQLVKIYKQNKKDELKDIKQEDNPSYSELIASYEPLKIFIGKSDDEYNNGPYYDGNSILLYINKNKNDGLYNYVFIGDTIFSFTTKSPIIRYDSPVGNSDIPWPFAVDENDIYYLLTENVLIKMDKFARDQNNKLYIDPYAYFYDAVEKGKSINDYPILENKKIIHKRTDDNLFSFYIDAISKYNE